MSSSSETSVVAGFDHGVPSKCVCGAGVMIFTSRTEENPGRPFFRCITKRDPSSWTIKRDSHLFKWVEDAVYEEVQDALPKLGIMANEIVKTKTEVNDLIGALQDLKEEALWSKMEIRKFTKWLRVCFVYLCFVSVGIAYIVVVKAKQTNFGSFALGY
ncbi:PREDICTED: uncharacterized protein At1g43920, Chloroplastic-like [Camelina sativa]|uniref:Uncharacterized protein At1g43920, Chloroplastic-like n=1 Tax=Camelina sativa TaxID=90675 RepID=A0ABM0U6L5_CAMSA|nr:PREDICTED: uncharacterized protein At1g43920, Chloroplastic-like [Camelina sativa]